ncbi:MAG: HAD-IA family hydrolase [Bacteroidetes bacterium]|nr:HAD-IA family hydrolase [Bacteroidota bacterium]
MNRTDILCKPKAVFWDFDGVIKESLEVKSRAFYNLFLPFGDQIANRVCKHHIANGGMSRGDKIPLYLHWAGQPNNAQIVDDFCMRFSEMVLEAVVEAPWVPGVETLLRTNPHRQLFFVVSATPQKELEEILKKLNLTKCFLRIFGSPTRKADAIQLTLSEQQLASRDCLMIGDALVDIKAAAENAVPFLLRRHLTNENIFSDYVGPHVKDFLDL